MQLMTLPQLQPDSPWLALVQPAAQPALPTCQPLPLLQLRCAVPPQLPWPACGPPLHV